MGDTARKTRRASVRSLERSPSPRPGARRKSLASPAPSKAAGKEKRGWHASVGGSPAVRGNTPLKRLAALFGVLLLMVITGPVAVSKCVACACASHATVPPWGGTRVTTGCDRTSACRLCPTCPNSLPLRASSSQRLHRGPPQRQRG